MPFGSVKYTERMKPWSTTVGDLGARREQPLAQHLERVLVGDVERDVVELDGAVARPARRLGERLGPLHLEERDRVAAAHLEEVVAHRPGHGGGGEAHAEHADVEAHGGVHVGGDERQVVDALPAGSAVGQFVRSQPWHQSYAARAPVRSGATRGSRRARPTGIHGGSGTSQEREP